MRTPVDEDAGAAGGAIILARDYILYTCVDLTNLQAVVRACKHSICTAIVAFYRCFLEDKNELEDKVEPVISMKIKLNQ
jgi:hypothetical protein